MILFSALPQLSHILERLTFSLRYETPDKESGEDAHQTVEAVGEPMTEVGAGMQVHVEHRYERRAYQEVEDPLKGHGDGYCRTANGVGEDLGDEYPADRPPRKHEAGGVDHDAHHRDDAQRGVAEGDCHTKGTDGHADGPPDEQWLAAYLLYGEHGDEGE